MVSSGIQRASTESRIGREVLIEGEAREARRLRRLGPQVDGLLTLVTVSAG